MDKPILIAICGVLIVALFGCAQLAIFQNPFDYSFTMIDPALKVRFGSVDAGGQAYYALFAYKVTRAERTGVPFTPTPTVYCPIGAGGQGFQYGCLCEGTSNVYYMQWDTPENFGDHQIYELEHGSYKEVDLLVNRFSTIGYTDLTAKRQAVADICYSVQNEIPFGYVGAPAAVMGLHYPANNPVCGNRQCEDGETTENCPKDCPAAPVCGNGVCEGGEEPNGSNPCPADCGSGAVCGNQICEAGEHGVEPNCCYIDCHETCTYGNFCGDGVCGSQETQQSCPADCGAPSSCGNGRCETGENPTYNGNCEEDCWVDYLWYCGNGVCGIGEDEWLCPADCHPIDLCGDGVCQLTEDEQSCPVDCLIAPNDPNRNYYIIGGVVVLLYLLGKATKKL